MRTALIAVTALGLAAGAAPALSQCPQAEILAADVAPFSAFGSAVALSDGQLWIGSPGWVDPASGDERGKVYRMSSDGTLLGAFVPGTGVGTRYGAALDVDGGTVVVGAPFADVPLMNNGRVWFHSWNGAGWDTQTFVSDPPFKNANFGAAVAVEGDVIAVGAPGFFTPGRVHLYRRSAGVWALEQVIGTGLPPQTGTDLGQSVALEDGRLFVGDPVDLSVAVYVHDGSAWNEIARIDTPVPDDPQVRFGHALAVDGEHLLVSGTMPNQLLSDASRVFTYRETTPGVWTHEQTLGLSEASSLFGHAVALSGDRALVGAPWAGGYTVRRGLVHAYAHDGSAWVQTHVLTPTVIQSQTQFGFAVDLDDSRWLGGLLQLDVPAHVTGVQLFDQAAMEFTWTDVGSALAGSAGTPSLSADKPLCQGATVTLTGSAIAPAGSVFLVAGLTRADLPFKGGVLVPFPDLVVGPFAPALDGVLELAIPIETPVPAGVELLLQLWIAGGGGPVGFSATNGLQGVTAP